MTWPRTLLLSIFLLARFSQVSPTVATVTDGMRHSGDTHPNATSTPEPRRGDWKIFNKDGDICMRMSFAAQFNISYKTTDAGLDEVAITVDPGRATVASACGSTERSFQLYPFGNVNALWFIRMTFEVKSKYYDLTGVTIGWQYDKTMFKDGDVPFGNVTWESAKSDNFLDEPVLEGLAYACSEDMHITTDYTSLRFTQIRFQPYADVCKEDKTTCSAVECRISGNREVVIVVAVLSGIAVVAFLIVILACAIKRSKKKLPPYYNIQYG